MTTRFIPANRYHHPGSEMEEDPQGNFVHYLDYARVVLALKWARLTASDFQMKQTIGIILREMEEL